MKRLILAEKPSLAKAIAKGLASEGFIADREDRTMIDLGNIRIIKMVGHVLGLNEPHDYDTKYASWNKHHLPIIPETFAYKVSQGKEAIVKDAQNQLMWCDEVINAGDPDREGQTLVDELLEYCGYQGKVKRLLIADTSDEGVKKALQDIRDNEPFEPLYQAGKLRGIADWLLGINFTRLITTLAQQEGYKGVISVGRVQTAILGLIVRRMQEIESFVITNYYELGIKIEGTLFLGLMERIFEYETAEIIREACYNEYADVVLVEEQIKEKGQPKAYSLATIQKEAADIYGYKAADTLADLQKLYEEYKLTTYPRSDCEYLPNVQFEERNEKINRIYGVFPELKEMLKGKIDVDQKTSVWNDKKVTAHFGIIPTNEKVDSSVKTKLSGSQWNIYQLVCRRYLQLFMGKEVKKEKTVKLSVTGRDGKTYEFGAKGSVLVEKGFMLLATKSKDLDKESEQESEANFTHDFKKGERFQINDIDVLKKKTTPPKNYTESNLLSAMNNAKKYLKQERNVEKAQLGTPATQAEVIQKLEKVNLIERKGKNIIATQTGIELIEVLPDVLTYPDLTVIWEEYFDQVANKKIDAKEIQKKIINLIEMLVNKYKDYDLGISSNQEYCVCPKCGGQMVFVQNNKVRMFKCERGPEKDMEGCDAVLFGAFNGKKLTVENMKDLLEGKTLKPMSFKNKEGKPYQASLKMEVNAERLAIKMEFNNKIKKKTGRSPQKKKWGGQRDFDRDARER